MEPKETILSIYSKADPNKKLKDCRHRTCGFLMGTIKDVAKQFGITMEKDGDYYKYSAPKIRLQLFIESLHFSGTRYVMEKK